MLQNIADLPKSTMENPRYNHPQFFGAVSLPNFLPEESTFPSQKPPAWRKRSSRNASPPKVPPMTQGPAPAAPGRRRRQLQRPAEPRGVEGSLAAAAGHRGKGSAAGCVQLQLSHQRLSEGSLESLAAAGKGPHPRNR